MLRWLRSTLRGEVSTADLESRRRAGALAYSLAEEADEIAATDRAEQTRHEEQPPEHDEQREPDGERGRDRSRRGGEPEQKRDEAEHGGCGHEADPGRERRDLVLDLGHRQPQLELDERAGVVGDAPGRSGEALGCCVHVLTLSTRA